MALSNLQYDNIRREYDNDRMEAEREASVRKAEILSKVAGYKELDDMTANLSLEYTKKALGGDKSALSSLKDRLRQINDKKSALLVSNGYNADYLLPVYKCPDCKDTGYIDGVKCHCFRLKETEILYDQSGIRSELNTASFDNLSEGYYSGEDLEHFKESRTKSLNFVNSFGSDYQNLLFYGTVGTGKSMLSSCIAGDLLRRGHSVLYFSSSALIERLAKNTFERGGVSSTDNNPIYECELLIIDDLGTEMTNSFTVAALFALLNERFLRKKPVIISTNLSLEELQARYTDRIFSRLTGNFTFCRLSGADIRIARKFAGSI